MATILLSAVGASIGGTFGGAILGVTGAAIGKAIGASVGGLIDQKIMGSGSRVLDTGRIETFRLQGVTEGAPIPRVMGRVRIAGQLIWSSAFEEHVASSSSGGKATSAPRVTTNSYEYSVNVAFALGEGVVDKVGRIWADGQEISRASVSMAFYPGDETQNPDPKIAAIEGLENAPSYRGTSYVVFENLDLAQFGNRIPQMNFEVYRKAQPEHYTVDDPSQDIQGVCLIPGSGEYSLATTQVVYPGEFSDGRSANVNTLRGDADVVHALEDLNEELPNAKSVSLVVSWFGDDLRVGDCQLTPRVEQTELDGDSMPWVVSGVTRAAATTVSRIDDRPVFGGTPTDASVIEAIQKIKELESDVVFYPFILMDIQENNGLPDPYSDNPNQQVMPWRGRITSSEAAGRPGSPDGTIAAKVEVETFFGTASASDFTVVDGAVIYTGPAEWSYRRFVLHYAALCVAAGGVEAFNIGSELRGVTSIRDGLASFPAVVQLQLLAQEVRAVLGEDAKIGYAADWSEYFGHHPQDGSGDVFFHLDPLWAQTEIDYIGIDNYMPLSDWRDNLGHLDEGEGSIYSLDYLRKNVAGGEGFDWYYPNQVERDAQNRVPITDGAYGEPWVFRYKDLVNWWSREHYNRIGGIRVETPTQWLPQSKPFRFTELGCPATDKGTNQPNVFFDPKSSESAMPYFSNGSVDGLVQKQYLRATYAHWQERANNPVSDIYFKPMVDLENSHVWAWDARPWPDFPNRLDVWSDGGNHARGHWLTGRFAEQSLAAIVSEVCEISGLQDIDVSELYGQTIGFAMRSLETGRQSLQPLMMAFDFSSGEVDGKLRFRNRTQKIEYSVAPTDLAIQGKEPAFEKLRQPEAETIGRVRVSFWDDMRDYQTGTSEFVRGDDTSQATSHVELPLTLLPTFGVNLAARWLSEARIARDEINLALPMSVQHLTTGDVVRLSGSGTDAIYRVERIEEQGARRIEGTRVEQTVFKQKDVSKIIGRNPSVPLVSAVHYQYLDLPMLRSNQDPFSPFVAATSAPWPGFAAVYTSHSDDGYVFNASIDRPNQFATTLSSLRSAFSGRWSRAETLRVRLSSGVLQSRSELEVFAGANTAVIGDGSSTGWEVFQFKNAELQGDGTYLLNEFLRGQLGTEAEMQAVWPAESKVIFLDDTLSQLSLSDADRGVERFFRVGPGNRVVSDPSFTTFQQSFSGVSLRPLSPVHLAVRKMFIVAPDVYYLRLTWKRRSRIEGDNWQNFEVPLGEANETYIVRVLQGGNLLREDFVGSPKFIYEHEQIVGDGVEGLVTFEVAQVSEKYGPGVFERIEFNV